MTEEASGPERTIHRPARRADGFAPSTPLDPRLAPSPPPPLSTPSDASSAATPGNAVTFDFAEADPELYGPEPLVAAASRLMRLGSRLRTLPGATDLRQLRSLVNRELEAFAKRARELGLELHTVQLAHYTLCAFLDDSVMSTPWGANGIWAQHSLLATYHNDVEGGDRLFRVAETLEADPRREPRVMDLLYLCLSLGFEGRMALSPQGAGLLQRHRQRLHEAIARGRGVVGSDLSPQWRGTPTATAVYRPVVPLWAILAGVAVALLVVFSALLFRLSARSDAAIAALSATVGTEPMGRAPPLAAPMPGLGRITRILQPDIDAGRLAVLHEGSDVVIRLVNQGLFESGTADLARDYSATFQRIAEAARIAGGPLRIGGHTDNQPLRTSLLFPSNQRLSEARAEVVRKGLTAAGIPPDRMAAQGYADTRPIADNATADGRRENRRVEIRAASNTVWE